MPFFTKKPVTIEARQNDDTHEGREALVDWVRAQGGKAMLSHTMGMIYIETLEGEMMAYPGDWIIRGVKGEFYPCKPDIFEATYEAAE